jgi:16S rRNA (cytosine967-C5)-methyltransferase
VSELSARAVATTALRIWRVYDIRSDLIISKLLAENKLSTSDRAFALELFYGVLRNLSLLDFWIGCLRAPRVDIEDRDILRLGLYQLLMLGTPEHAAVNESVELAPPKVRGFINGMLRAAVRERDELRTRARSQPPSIRTSHPDFLISRWQKHFGGKAAAALCAWNNQAPPLYGRINRLKLDPEQFMQRYSDWQPFPKNPSFLRFTDLPAEALQRGHCYIQDPSTAIASQLLDPQPGEKILDACAAPGGKTGHLAELMQNRGVIVACDREPKRVGVLEENMRRLGVGIAQVYHHDWTKRRMSKEIESAAPFDRILIDVPCTNTGVMRRRVDVRWRLRANSVAHMRSQQLEIVRAVSRLLKPGGTVVYSTCSLEPEENEQAVQQLLLEFVDWRLVEQKYSRPFEDELDGAFAAKLVRTQVDTK